MEADSALRLALEERSRDKTLEVQSWGVRPSTVISKYSFLL
jgi:hypothetical protein